MTVAEVVMQKLRELSPERQREVLDFVGFLESRSGRAGALAQVLSASEDAVVSKAYPAELQRMRSADQKRS